MTLNRLRNTDIRTKK